MIYNLPNELLEIIIHKRELNMIENKYYKKKITGFFRTNSLDHLINNNKPISKKPNKLFYISLVNHEGFSIYKNNTGNFNPISFINNSDLISKSYTFKLLKELVEELSIGSESYGDYKSDDDYEIDTSSIIYGHVCSSMMLKYGIGSRIVIQLLNQVYGLVYEHQFDKVISFYDSLDLEWVDVFQLLIFFFESYFAKVDYFQGIKGWNSYHHIYTIFVNKYLIVKSKTYLSHLCCFIGSDYKSEFEKLKEYLNSDDDRKFVDMLIKYDMDLTEIEKNMND